ncbi:MAG: universal stress protein [Geminicoccaceae bacterium]
MTKHVLLPVDPDEKSSWERALPEAVAQAKQRGATLHVMSVVPTFGSSIVASFFPEDFEERAIKEAERELATLIKNEVPADLPHQLIVAHGSIHREILKTAEAVNADLIVMASHKPALSDAVLAPNAAQVLLHSSVSVLVVR